MIYHSGPTSKTVLPEKFSNFAQKAKSKSFLRKPSLKSAWLNCFVMAAQKSSCSTAAHNLGLTPQALRRNLLELETHLGAQLLMGKRDTVELTPLGKVLFEDAIQILRELQHISSCLPVLPVVRTKDLALGCTSDWIQNLMLPLCEILKKRRPGQLLRIEKLGSLSDLEQALVEGKLDMALDWREPVSDDIAFLSSPPIQYIVVTAPGLKRSWDAWHYATPNVCQGTFKPWDHVEYPPLIQMESSDFNALLEMALSGLYAIYVPECLVRGYLGQGRLEIVAEPPMCQTLTPYVLWPKSGDDRGIRQVAQIFADALLQ
ncbi:MAG: LysR family transcriptional regulator [Candidatus Sericytochromatia bacterium]